jgi:hypothetical protein
MKWIIFFAGLLPTAAALFAQDAPAATDKKESANNACIACHQNLPGKLSAVVQEWQQSVHFANHITCDGCHGGDPTLLRAAFATEDEFKRRSHLHRDTEFTLLSQKTDQYTSFAR